MRKPARWKKEAVTLTYVLGDVHGRADRFRAMLDRIRFTGQDTLYLLGDMIDRNPDGIELLQQVRKTENMQMILGNHEHMMLQALAEPTRPLFGRNEKRDLWYYNGGEVTHRAFRSLEKTEQKELLDWLADLPLNLELNCAGRDWLLVHGSPAASFPTRGHAYPDETSYAVWERLDPFTENDFPELTILCGHTPTVYFRAANPMEIVRNGNVICLDCGCAFPQRVGGRLACLCLETDEVFYTD